MVVERDCQALGDFTRVTFRAYTLNRIRNLPTVFARSEIPRLRFGTGSAISAEGDEIAAHLSGARNDGLTNQATTRITLIRTSNETGGPA